jgi:hypothetical protein
MGAEQRVHAWMAARRSWGWGGELRGLGWDFYRREREGWRLGHELLGEGRPGGQIRGRSYLVVAGEAHRGSRSAHGKKIPPCGGFLRGRAGFRRPAGISRVLAGPHGRAGSVTPGCAGQLACRRWDRAEGGERKEKV